MLALKDVWNAGIGQGNDLFSQGDVSVGWGWGECVKIAWVVRRL